MGKQLPKKSYSAYELAALKLPGMPTTAKGWYQLVAREQWLEVQATGSGRGRKGGIRREFIPPDNVRALIDGAHQAAPLNTQTESAAEKHPRAIQYVERTTTTRVTGEGVSSAPSANEHPKPTEEFAYIDKYVNVRGSAGPGQEVHDEAIVQVRVDARLLRERVGNSFSKIKIAGVSGDSMYPTLSHGDQVLVDTSVDRFIENAIYAIQQDGNLRFKRIQLKLDGSIIVKSDNPNYGEPEVYTAEEAQHFKVIGIVTPFKFGRFKL